MARLHVTTSNHADAKKRIHVWIDTAKLEEQFGIEVKIGDRWCHLIQDGRILLFPRREKALAYLKD